MRLRARVDVDDHVLSPVVIAVLVFGVVLRMLSLWLLPTFRWDEFADWFEHTLPGGLAVDHVLHATGGMFLLLLAHEFRQARNAAASVRRGRIVGVALAALAIGGVHFLALSMRRVADLERYRAAPPTLADLRSEPLSVHFMSLDDGLPRGLFFDVRSDGSARVGHRSHGAEKSVLIPDGALERLREILARTDYCELADDQPLRFGNQHTNVLRCMVFWVGLRRHSLVLMGRGYDDPGGGWGTPIEPDERARIAVVAVWGEVLDWFDDGKGLAWSLRTQLQPK